MDDIFSRDKAGEVITRDDPDLGKIMDVIFAAQKLIAELNTGYKTQEEVRALFSKLTGVEVDPSFCLLPPFYTDFGRNIRVGKMFSSTIAASSWTGAASRLTTAFSSRPKSI